MLANVGAVPCKLHVLSACNHSMYRSLPLPSLMVAPSISVRNPSSWLHMPHDRMARMSRNNWHVYRRRMLVSDVHDMMMRGGEADVIHDWHV